MLRSAYWLTLLLFVGLAAAKFSPQTGLTSLIRFGDTWQERRHSALASEPIATAIGSNGYDGQFYAQIALDPTLRSAEFDSILDVPAYRARRILVPAAATLLGLGHPWWILHAYAALNLVCWAALAWLLRRELDQPDTWVAFARWVACLTSLGVLDSVRQSLVDLPALVLLTLAIRASRRCTTPASPSTLWLALGNLAKETNLLAALAVHADALLTPARRRRALFSLLLATVPFILWAWYVHQRFVSSTSSSSNGLGNFTWPFFGLLNCGFDFVRQIANGNLDSRYTFGLIGMGGLLLQAIVLWRQPRFEHPWWRVGALYALLLPFLGVWVWSGYWAACRALLPLTIAFNLLLPANRSFWLLWALGNLTALHAFWRFL